MSNKIAVIIGNLLFLAKSDDLLGLLRNVIQYHRSCSKCLINHVVFKFHIKHSVVWHFTLAPTVKNAGSKNLPYILGQAYRHDGTRTELISLKKKSKTSKNLYIPLTCSIVIFVFSSITGYSIRKAARS